MNESKHTPLPWFQEEDDRVYGGLRNDLVSSDLSEADGRLIVRAVNAHDDLVEALEDVLQIVAGDRRELTHKQGVLLAQARAALAKAKGES